MRWEKLVGDDEVTDEQSQPTDDSYKWLVLGGIGALLCLSPIGPVILIALGYYLIKKKN